MDAYTKAAEILGMPGRMISASKSMYTASTPDAIVVFNGNVVTESGAKIWYGDLDLGNDESKVVALAEALGEKLYVLREHDARFENEANPKLDKAVYVTP